MNLAEAWIVTFLGMGVVFVGLVLCITSINLFNRLAKHVTWGEEGHGHGAPAPQPSPMEAPAPPIQPTPSPEVAAVIAVALEIDRRLYLGRTDQRLTLRRTEP